MRILIIHHHPLPSKDSSVMGGGLRAHHIAVGLRSAGWEVQFLCKEQWLSHWSQIMASTIEHLSPDVILCIQLEDAALLPSVDCPVIIDLYAPRLLEVAFAQDQQQTATNILLALSRGDVFLITNKRQRWHWMGIFALAGIDVRTDPSVIVPLAADAHDRSPPENFILVGGGINWPWQSPIPSLTAILNSLDKLDVGEVHWYLGPDDQLAIEHPRLSLCPWTDRKTYRQHLSRCSIALDIDQPSPERSLALGFRHLEYLGCGLPIISTSQSALGALVPNACLQGSDLPTLLLRAQQAKWQRKASLAAQDFAQKNSPSKVVSSLLSWLESPVKRSHHTSSLLQLATTIQENDQFRLQHQEQTLKIAELERNLDNKKMLITSLNTQIQEYSGTVHRLARSIDEVASFKQTTAQVMGNEIHHHRDQANALIDQNALLNAENAKKTAELQAMDQLCARLENDIQNLRIQLHNQRKRFWS